ncbi:MAG TPA: heparan-alpha-glucosaminide N-acetyltransferase domain-containing protein [Steroidobacteraceae bacterium]|nr:heparan-alpha-glucosaminide N-acetyltransferase domain-containing protein [Steroidobacteraceae bacterium]
MTAHPELTGAPGELARGRQGVAPARVATRELGDRFLAIDVMRGLTLALMIVVNLQIGEGKSYAQLLHARWDGLTLTDLVFPTFMFVVGTSLSFTLERYQRLGNASVLRKVLTRTALIFLCGYLLYWFPFFRLDAAGHIVAAPISHTRIFGVLQRIALGYGAAALIVHYGRRAGAVAFGVAALLVYWWMMHSLGDYSLAGNAEIRLDKLVLGEGHMYHGEGVAFDPEGILSTLPAIVNVLAGYLAGRFVRDRGTHGRTIAALLAAAAVCVLLALWWDGVFPINKKLWTSSYVLCTVGIDLGVLAVLVYLLPQGPHRAWTYFFEVFGRNTLVIYLLSEAAEKLLHMAHIGPQSVLDWVYTFGFASWAGDKAGSLLYAIAYMLCCWTVAYAMDRRRIYVKL